MKAEHTKGPWHVGIGNGIGSVFGPEECRSTLTEDGTALAPICMMVTGFDGIVHRDKFTPEDHANARLIAAAPDLLEALKEIAEGKGRFSRDPLTHAINTITDMVAIAKAAIALAEEEGRQ